MKLSAKPELGMLIAQKGYNYVQAAEVSGISHVTMQKVLKGKNTIPSVAKKICDAFEIYMWHYFELK